MSSGKSKLRGGKTGAAIAVRVIPRASKNEVVEVLDDGTVKIRLTSPPVEGKANQTLIKFLSGLLGLPQSKIEIVAGHKGRNKLITILGLDAETVERRLLSGHQDD
ncbi:MAG TPA: DUF167 domain-containing protein [Anaerolineales bacterium]|nr:DUF167 domain-containing protein [Anaerolineales bacterium]